MSIESIPENDVTGIRGFALAFFLLLVTCGFGFCTLIAIQNAQTNVLEWADDDAVTTKEFESFKQLFETPDFAVATWPTKSWDDPSYEVIATQLNESKLFRSVTDSVSSVRELSESSRSISHNSAIKRLESSLIGPDRQQGCVIALLSDEGRQRRCEAIEMIRNAAESNGIKPTNLKLGGIAAELAWLEDDGIQAPLALSPFSGLICWLVCCLGLRSLKLGTALTMISGLSGLSIFFLMVLLNSPLDAINATLPVLGLLLTASLGLHWLGYFQRLAKGSVDAAVQQATRHALLPGILSIMTTGLGMLSLVFSNTPAIGSYGALGAASVVLSGLWIFLVFPEVIRQIASPKEAQESVAKRSWIMLSKRIEHWRVPLLIVLLALMGAACLGLKELKTSVRLDGLFRSDHQAVEDAKWIEDRLGGLASMELVVTIPKEDDADDQTRLLRGIEMVRDLESRLRTIPDVKSTFSAYHVVPPVPTGRNIGATARRRAYRNMLDAQIERLRELGLFRRDAAGDHWRISNQITTFHSGQRKRSELSCEIRRVCTSVTELSDHKPTLLVTGIPLLIESIEQQFLHDLVLIYAVAVLLIFFAVWIGFQSLSIAIFAMIPNMFPPLVILGLVGWSDVALDVGSVMTASIALGIAVDDTIHLLVSVKRANRRGHGISSSVRRAILHSGPAVFRTSILGVAGMAVLCVSPFLPTARFGVLMACMLVAAIIGDLVMLPAMINTSLGKRVFQRCFGNSRDEKQLD